MRRFLHLVSAGLAAIFVGAQGWAYPDHPATSAEMTTADIAARDKALADDRFEGRGPGTVAGEAAAQWIADELQRIGIAPGNGGRYFQDVPTAVISLDKTASTLSIATAKGTLAPAYLDDVVYWTGRYRTDTVKLAASPLVFVGYGVVAPEYGWDDYAGIDVRGKTVVVLINDPGNEDAAPDPAFFKGKAMTYYGRWTYKYEEAARHGAAAVLIVHETVPAAYGWQVVRNSNSGATSWLLSADKNDSQLAVRAWISLATAHDLFARAGLDYAAMKKAANARGFRAVPLSGETLSAELHSRIQFLSTRNVVGVLKGTRAPDDYVLYSAHWDHLGIKPDVAGPDKIYNGAIDNAMGVALVLEAAEKFAHAPRTARSLAFLFPSLEEQGLLGAQYFAEHPLWPLSHIVGDINLDGATPSAGTHDIALPGNGQNELEDVLAAALKKQGRIVSPDPMPEHGGFFRADHFAFAKLGVPAISPGSGGDFVVGGPAAAKAAADDYTAHHYHQPTDEFDPAWDLRGPLQDLEALYDAGRSLAEGTAWPAWRAGSEFKAARDAMAR